MPSNQIDVHCMTFHNFENIHFFSLFKIFSGPVKTANFLRALEVVSHRFESVLGIPVPRR